MFPRHQVIKLPLGTYSACRVAELRLKKAGFTCAWHYYVPKVMMRAAASCVPCPFACCPHIPIY